jgi:hypothetical protein
MLPCLCKAAGGGKAAKGSILAMAPILPIRRNIFILSGLLQWMKKESSGETKLKANG